MGKILLTLSAACMLLLPSCKLFLTPDYKDFRNLKISKWGIKESTVSMDLVYYNPNNYGFQIKKSETDVYVDGIYLGKAISDSLIKVDKKSEFIIPILLKTDMKNVFKNAWNALTHKTVLVQVKGTMTAGVAGVFKPFKVNYEGRHEPDLFD